MSMDVSNFLRHSYIKINRYILNRKFLAILGGPLKGYKWNTSCSYDYITGNYEDGVALETITKWLHADSVFYDLGANVGYYSFLANKIIKNGVIYAFEPVPRNTTIFQAHLKLNENKIKYQNINLLPYAISNKDQIVVFSNDDDCAEGNSYVNSSFYTKRNNTFEVKSYSVDSLVESGYNKPDIIKIDVEGAEYDVLLGAVKTLTQYRPKILLATHDCHVPGVQKKCVDFLEEMGYTLTRMDASIKKISGLDDYIAVHTTQIINN